MQVTGTFPELTDGMGKKPRANSSGKFRAKASGGIGGFQVKRAPKQNSAPKSLTGRRNASRSLVNGKSTDPNC